MSRRPKNLPMGEVQCPHDRCTRLCPIFRFRPRTEGRKTFFTGKYYLECPDHGRIGSDGAPALTEYILEKGKFHGPPKGPAPAPEKSRAGASAPAQRSVQSSAPRPTPRPAPARSGPAPEPAPTKPRWWEPVI